MKDKNADKEKRIREALGAAEENLQAVRELLREEEKHTTNQQTTPESNKDSRVEEEDYDVVGKEGYFDGLFMVTDDDKQYQVPPNYASKSTLVVGDRLRITNVDETGSKYEFKQLNRIERKEIEGTVIKKDNKWAIHTKQGTFYLIAAAVRYFGIEIGDVIKVQVPAEPMPMEVEWAAIEEVEKEDKGFLKNFKFSKKTEGSQSSQGKEGISEKKQTEEQKGTEEVWELR